MRNRNRLALIVPALVIVLLMLAMQLTLPAQARQQEWEEFALPQGYFPLGIRFFDEQNGAAWGTNHSLAQIEPFLLTTQDGGVTWTEDKGIFDRLKNWSRSFNMTISGHTIRSSSRFSSVLELFPLSADELLAGGMVHNQNQFVGSETRESDTYRVFYTLDGGKNWSSPAMQDETPDARLETAVLVPGGGSWISLYDNITQARQLFFSRDGGDFDQQFISDLPNNAVKELTFPRADFGYAEVFHSSSPDVRLAQELRVTRDGGLTWTALPLLPDLGFENLSDFFFLDEQTGWAAGFARGEAGLQPIFLRTTDGGETWQSARLPAEQDWVDLQVWEMKFQNPHVGYALAGVVDGTGTRQGVLYLSADGGTTWEEVLRDEFIGCLETTGAQVFICTDAAILSMELPAARPTPTPTSTPTHTPIPPTRTPIPTPTPTPAPSGLEALNCGGSFVIALFLLGLIWLGAGRR